MAGEAAARNETAQAEFHSTKAVGGLSLVGLYPIAQGPSMAYGPFTDRKNGKPIKRKK